MAKRRGKQYEADNKWFKQMLNAKVKCPCGHSIVMRPMEDGKICSHCKRYVPNKRKDFKETLKKMLGDDNNE